MKSFTVRRKNAYFYRHRKRRSAVGSHSVWGSRNPGGHSSYIPNENVLSAEERKATILPCNYSIKSTWAALRKCWLGFEISLSNEDREGMTEFASRIRKLQRQLAVDTTNFDLEILSEEAAKRIDELYSIPGMRGVDGSEKKRPDSAPQEREIDYDDLLGSKLLNEDNHHVSSIIKSPRKAIFSTYKSRVEKSSPQSNRTRIIKETVNYKKSCPVGPLKSPVSSPIVVKKLTKYRHDKTCFTRSGEQDNEIPDDRNYNGSKAGEEVETDYHDTKTVERPDNFQISDSKHVIHEDTSRSFQNEKEKMQKRDRSCLFKSEK